MRRRPPWALLDEPPILAVSSVSGLTADKIEELEAAGYIVIDVLTIDCVKLLNGREVEAKVLPQLSRWQRFLSVFR